MPLMRRLREDESGTSLLILVFALVVLLGFAAFAVDAAGAWALKRQDQSAADTGAIAAGLFTAGKTKAQAISDATDEVIRITYNTVDPNMTQAEWRTESINCADGSKPAIFTDVGISDCISFSSNLGKIRVQTPDGLTPPRRPGQPPNSPRPALFRDGEGGNVRSPEVLDPPQVELLQRDAETARFENAADRCRGETLA